MDGRRLKVAAHAAFQAMSLGIVKGCPLACVDCGLVQWFSTRPERADDA